MHLRVTQMWRSFLLLAAMTPGTGAQTAPTTDDLHAPFPTESHVCEGTEIVRESCTMQPCGNCVPQDCVFQGWTSWTTMAGCNGIATRTRTVLQKNNICGAPCDGAMIESKKVPLPPECSSTEPVDCQLSQWSSWSQCRTSVSQSFRTRKIALPAYNGGKACTGQMNITKPCGNPVNGTMPCQFSDWHQWTQCSRNCGGGWKTRYRRIKQKSGFQAAPCEGNMSQILTCSTEPCMDNQDCTFNPWGDWQGCDNIEPNQQLRIRTIATYASGSGSPCTGNTRELQGCVKASQTDKPCELDDWSPWSQCTASCQGGQKSRWRRLKTPAIGLGTCTAMPLQAVEECNTDACDPEKDCKFTAWSPWTSCTPACGKGINYRYRDTESPAVLQHDDAGCKGVLREVGSCESAPCVLIDCVWGLWAEWTGCTASCGGGTKRRSRVIEHSPRHGGRLCMPNSKEELSPCNTQSCDGGCRNATWSDWEPWSTCSVTCGQGYEMRERGVAQEASAVCGTPVSGPMEEFRECLAPSCTTPIDCKLSTWQDWSACSASCFGIRHRTRVITVFPSEGGKQCDATQLNVVEGCNPGPGLPPSHECDATPSRDCIIEDWGDWSHCPITCGGGQQIRTRQILAPPSHNGKACRQDLAQTKPCNTVMCNIKCIDCHWGMWSEWGACTKCNGQRWRSRTILQHPNHCGEPCKPRSAKEVSNCTGDCSGQVYCTWTTWNDWDLCSAECGPAVQKRQRSLGLQVARPWDFLFSGKAPLVCTGTIFDTKSCPTKPCEKKCDAGSCSWNAWSDWSAPACTGLCQRSRTIRALNTECGPCRVDKDYPTIESKTCPSDCSDDKPMDCEWHDWGAWTRCKSINGQHRRARGIKQMPQAGGKPCNGTEMMETAPCKGTKQPIDCSWSPWAVWSRCSVNCGNGWQMRNRHFIPAANGGAPCMGTMKELQPCAEQSCGKPTNCVMSDWTTFSACYANGQKVRTRSILTYAIPPGLACNGSLREVLPCGPGVDDCQLGDWTSWDLCDKKCDGGQEQRHRQIVIYPRNGGNKCPQGGLIQTRGCNTQPCGSGNCKAFMWSDWGFCDAECGPGQQLRTRAISQLRSPKGEGCDFALNETRPCRGTQACGIQDCEWNDWQQWGACSCTCGGGQKRRYRSIKKSAMAGGLPCRPENFTEIGECNTRSCCDHPAGIDGTWKDWGEWSPCSSSCGKGITFRNREFGSPANEFGKAATGDSQEVQLCMGSHSDCVNVDCVWNDWSPWGACSPTCFGSRFRSRTIKTQGRGQGAFCTGPVKEQIPCNPTTKIEGDASSGYNDPPVACPKLGESRDCRYSFWSTWVACSTTCGGGQQSRARVTTTPASHGGKPCNASLMETRGCSTAACPGSNHPVYCEWADWSPWSACDKCDGQRLRSRDIKTHASNGGLACAQSDGQEIQKCPRHCHEASFCVWGDWGPYNDCSVSCGSGMRSRQRSLVSLTLAQLKAHQLQSLSDEELAKIKLPRAPNGQAKRTQALAVAFLAGASSLIVVMGISRFVSRRRESSSTYSEGYSRTPASEEGTLTSLD